METQRPKTCLEGSLVEAVLEAGSQRVCTSAGVQPLTSIRRSLNHTSRYMTIVRLLFVLVFIDTVLFGIRAAKFFKLSCRIGGMWGKDSIDRYEELGKLSSFCIQQ